MDIYFDGSYMRTEQFCLVVWYTKFQEQYSYKKLSFEISFIEVIYHYYDFNTSVVYLVIDLTKLTTQI